MNPTTMGSFAECAGEEKPKNSIKKNTAKVGKEIVFFMRVLLWLVLDKTSQIAIYPLIK
jgi:hypothetical protein